VTGPSANDTTASDERAASGSQASQPAYPARPAAGDGMAATNSTTTPSSQSNPDFGYSYTTYLGIAPMARGAASAASAAAASEADSQQAETAANRQVSESATRAVQQPPAPPPAGRGQGAAGPGEAVPPAEAGKAVADAVPSARFRPELTAGGAWASPWSADAAPGGTEEVAEGRLDPLYSLAGHGALLLASQPGRLLLGAAPVNLPALERAAEGFLARLEGLAEDAGDPAVVHGLPPWLLAATVSATAVFELARRRAVAHPDAGPAGGADSSRESSPELALLPPGARP
jgi:hypothetical protein